MNDPKDRLRNTQASALVADMDNLIPGQFNALWGDMRAAARKGENQVRLELHKGFKDADLKKFDALWVQWLDLCDFTWLRPDDLSVRAHRTGLSPLDFEWSPLPFTYDVSWS